MNVAYKIWKWFCIFNFLLGLIILPIANLSDVQIADLFGAGYNGGVMNLILFTENISIPVGIALWISASMLHSLLPQSWTMPSEYIGYEPSGTYISILFFSVLWGIEILMIFQLGKLIFKKKASNINYTTY